MERGKGRDREIERERKREREYKSGGDYISKPPESKLKVHKLYIKEREVILLTIPKDCKKYVLLNSKSPGN
jgi:hypothetical protein